MRPREEAPIPVAARYRDNGPRLREPTAHLESPHRLAVGRHQHDGTVVDDDLHLALVVLDDKLIVLDGSPAFGSP